MMTETYIKIPKDVWDTITSDLMEMKKTMDILISREKLPTEDFITLKVFMKETGLKSTIISEMASGTHESGFHLRTERRPGSREKWIPKTELNRWVNFFRDQHPQLKKQFS